MLLEMEMEIQPRKLALDFFIRHSVKIIYREGG